MPPSALSYGTMREHVLKPADSTLLIFLAKRHKTVSAFDDAEALKSVVARFVDAMSLEAVMDSSSALLAGKKGTGSAAELMVMAACEKRVQGSEEEKHRGEVAIGLRDYEDRPNKRRKQGVQPLIPAPPSGLLAPMNKRSFVSHHPINIFTSLNPLSFLATFYPTFLYSLDHSTLVYGLTVFVYVDTSTQKQCYRLSKCYGECYIGSHLLSQLSCLLTPTLPF
jgi:hypothetical protein